LIDENIRLKEQNENLDIAYMAGLSDGKNKQSTDTNNIIELPFQLRIEDDISSHVNYTISKSISEYCFYHGINPTRIKGVLLEMKSEDK